jgi:hypothetical protein
VRCFVGRISRTLFLTRDSPASLRDGPAEAADSHLLLILTNLGCGTVLTALGAEYVGALGHRRKDLRGCVLKGNDCLLEVTSWDD